MKVSSCVSSAAYSSNERRAMRHRRQKVWRILSFMSADSSCSGSILGRGRRASVHCTGMQPELASAMRSRTGWSMRSRARSHALSEGKLCPMSFSTLCEPPYAEQWKQHWKCMGGISMENKSL